MHRHYENIISKISVLTYIWVYKELIHKLIVKLNKKCVNSCMIEKC